MTHTEFLAAKAALYEEYKNSTSASAGGGVITVISSMPNPDIQLYYAPLDVVKLNKKYHFPFHNTNSSYPSNERIVLQLNSKHKSRLYAYYDVDLGEISTKTSLNYSNYSGKNSFVPVINTKG